MHGFFSLKKIFGCHTKRDFYYWQQDYLSHHFAENYMETWLQQHCTGKKSKLQKTSFCYIQEERWKNWQIWVRKLLQARPFLPTLRHHLPSPMTAKQLLMKKMLPSQLLHSLICSVFLLADASCAVMRFLVPTMLVSKIFIVDHRGWYNVYFWLSAMKE